MYLRALFCDLLKMVKYCAINKKRLFLCTMLKNKILLAAVALVLSFSACQKAEEYDRDAQMQTDTEIIKKFVDLGISLHLCIPVVFFSLLTSRKAQHESNCRQ